jgi:hypothetical protein
MRSSLFTVDANEKVLLLSPTPAPSAKIIESCR